MKTQVTFKKLLLMILPYLLVGTIVMAISRGFAAAGGIDEYSSAFHVELPYLILVYASLLYLMRPGFLRAVVAAVPIICVYAGMDLYYIFMGNVPKLDDLYLLPEGLTVLPGWVSMVVFATIGIWIFCFSALFKRHLQQLVVPLLLLCLAALPPLSTYTMPQRFLHVTDDLGVSVISWSDRWTCALMGRVTSLLLFAATKHKALEDMASLPAVDGPDRDPDLLREALGEKRNIHIVVLESFLDPSRFSNLKFRTPPAPKRFAAVRRNMHVSRSPVFGGGTAQAEFEVLCGVPALKLYSPSEFNLMDGSATACLPNLLAKVGYRTIATQSYRPGFFNSEKAYKSLGFQEVNFPSVFAENRSTYLKYANADSYIFDGDLFNQNLSYLRKVLAKGKPVLNYVLGIYGHLPHEIDSKRFPYMVDVDGIDKNSQTYRAIQQFYYRAGALADYLVRLRKMDPKGLILVTSDHVPPLDQGPNTYKELGYSLRTPGGDYTKNIWIYEGPRGRKVSWPDHDYEFMDFLLDNLTDGRICKLVSCKNRKSWDIGRLTAGYNSIMIKGAGIVKKSTGLVAGADRQKTAPTVLKEAVLQKIH